MATAVPTDWNSLSGPGNTSVGNPADFGPYRGLIQQRGGVYDTRSNDQYDWAKSQFAKNAGVADEVQKRALDTGSMFTDWSKKDRSLYDESYVPAMKEQLDYARQYTTPERMAANRAGAMAGSNISFDASADMAKRALMGYGVDPSSGRFAGLDAALAAKRATSAAGAGTKSDRDTEMMGQQLMANAIRTGQVLPGQAANEAGVSIAANNQAINTGLATTASGAQTMGTGLQWAGMGDDMMKEWRNSLAQQTQLGMQQNKDVAEQQLAQQKLAQQSSSGIGAALGVAAPLLKTAGSMAMNYFLPGSGAVAGAMMGGGAGPLAGAGSGSTFRKGGPVRKFRAGGPVPAAEDDGEDENIHRGYRPKVRDEPARAHREPLDTSDWDNFETPDTDTEEVEGGRPQPGPEQDERRQKWIPGYAEGGYVGEDNTDAMPSFDPEGSDYDYRTARLAGIKRERDGHMASRDPVTGMQLKGRRHPTFDTAIENDRREGYGLEMRDGRYYTQKFADGGDVTGRVNEIWGDGNAPQAFAQGGGVPDDNMPDGNAPDDSMMVDTPPDEGGDQSNLVPPEASPSNGDQTDDVHALLNEGEFVIPKDVTSWFGEKFFQNLIQKAYKEKSSAQAQGEPASPQQQQAISMSPPNFESMGA